MRVFPPFPRRRAGLAGRYRYVFVVTYGRSGSTLLAGLLNTIPGYRIRGENGSALYRLYQADAAISQAHGKHGGGDASRSPRSPWYGARSWRPAAFRRALVDAFIAEILRPRAGDRVLGFKEVRYTEAHIPDLAAYLTFLRTAFPDAKIVFNHRAPDAVARSGWWTERPGSLERVRAADERLRSFAADERHFHFEFDRINGRDDLTHVRELFGFLGEDLDERRVRTTLATRHSYPANTAGDDRSAAPRRARAMARRVLNAVEWRR